MALPRPTEWADYTRSSSSDSQVSMRLDAKRLVALVDVATALGLTPSALAKLIVTAVADGETVSVAALYKTAGVR